ncbi:hypothetical protein BJ165DRAFT_1404509 [Panaeolus papilionaceus]|nr:hypothetical protein BJ165DRAFT_1404509 [Panaeolus papilionaceus]
MFRGFRGGFGGGGQFGTSRGFFDPNGFMQPTATIAINRPAPAPEPTSPSSNKNPPANTGGTNNGNSDVDKSGGGGGVAAAAAGSAPSGPSDQASNANKPSIVIHSVILPSPPVTTITTTAKPVSISQTDSSNPTAPASKAGTVSASRRNVVPVGLIVGVLFGGILITIVILLLVLWFRRRRKRKKILGATPYQDITHSGGQSKRQFEETEHHNLPPYTPPATGSPSRSASAPWSDTNEKPLLTTTTVPRTALQVSNRDSMTDAARSRWSNSTMHAVFQPPRYATLFRITSRPNTRHPSREHLPLPPPLPSTLPMSQSPRSPESDVLSYVSPVDQAGPSKW